MKIKGVEVGPLQPTADYKYLVFVDNLCPKDICKDIDFDLYLKTFEKPGGAPTFEVAEDDGMRLKDDGADLKDMEDLEDDAARDDFFADANQLPNNRDNKSNDDTPCAASGFGSSGCIHC